MIAYKFPADGYQTIAALALFLYVYHAAPGTVGSQIRNAVGGARTMNLVGKITIGIHVLEALAMLVVNISRGSSMAVTVRVAKCSSQLKWVATTFVLGYPSWISFSRTYPAWLC